MKNTDTAISFTEAQKNCEVLADEIKSKTSLLHEILTDYESHHVADDEIKRSLKCLENISLEKEYFRGKRVGSISAFFPLNLPLYSTVLFAIIPSLFAKQLYLRPPLLMRKTLRELFKVLGINLLFTNIKDMELERNEFVSSCASKSEVVIFTGAHNNAINLIKKLPKDILFLYNGAGINPIVVTDSASIDLAVSKTLEVRGFNSGQDCAGPDSILLHSRVAGDFIRKLVDGLKTARIGSYKDKETVIGKLIDPEHLLFVSKILLKYRDDIVYGGLIDFTRGIVHPTIIVTKIKEKKSYIEFFAPIFYITIYEKDSDLGLYFDNDSYINHAMYVSIFGESDCLSKVKRSTVLKNETILDIEEGNKEFGGYGPNSSFVATRGQITPKPILISREIYNYLIEYER